MSTITDTIVGGSNLPKSPGVTAGLAALSWEEVPALAPAFPVNAAWLIIAPPSSKTADLVSQAIGDQTGAPPSRMLLEAARSDRTTVAAEIEALPSGERRILLFDGPLEEAAIDWDFAWQLIETAQAVSAVHGARLWIVTQSAALRGPNGDPRLNFAWGAARSFAAECAESFGGLVDFQNSDPSSLLKLLVSDSEEDEYLLHDDRCFVPRLAPLADGSSTFTCDSSRLHLITGGLHGLAFEVAKWLVRKGASHLVIVGRSPLDTQRRERLLDLQQCCESVRYLELDVAQPDAQAKMAELVEGHADGLGCLFHLASSWRRNGKSAVLPLAQLAREDVREVLGAKSTGALAMHELASRFGATQLVYFSSAAATIGSPGQVSYAGANAVLDGLAELGAAVGTPCLSIAWGPIGGAGFGILDSGQGLHELWRKIGIDRLSLSDMFVALEAGLASGLATVTAIQLRDEAFSLPWLKRRPTFAGLQPKAEPKDEPAQEPATAATSRQAIEDQLLKRIPDVLSLPSGAVTPDSNLSEVGVDSLIALELMFTIERELQLRLPYSEAILDLNVSIREMAGRVAAMLKTDEISL